MSLKNTDRMANSAYPDQIAPTLFAQVCLSDYLR